MSAGSVVQLKGFVHCRPHVVTGKPEYQLFSADMSSMAGFGILVGAAVFEYQVPADFNPVAAQISSLNKQLEEASREFAAKVRTLKEQISRLEAIEYSPEVAS